MATAAKIVYSHITKDPEACGGRATIDSTRIRVAERIQHDREQFLKNSPDR